ncbi:MAG: MerR family transcriptional regulator [Proteobacteria bacterium]|nr:MerR family transcriptional regulator [Pseudomonadota bacterium]
MDDSLPIDQVTRATGLTARALRFYEARGLVSPLRTGSGRRLYGQAELERLHRITTLKRAGFTLSEIARLLGGAGPRRIEAVLRTQLGEAEKRLGEAQAAITALRDALSRIERGEPLDTATLCSLIHHGDRLMSEKAAWDGLSAQYMTDQAKADFAQAPYPEGFDQEAYSAKWADLGARIKAALPLDPASDAARAFLAEWQELLAPFTAIATPAMGASVKAMYDDMPNWQAGSPSPGFDHAVWQFIQAAGAANRK